MAYHRNRCAILYDTLWKDTQDSKDDTVWYDIIVHDMPIKTLKKWIPIVSYTNNEYALL